MKLLYIVNGINGAGGLERVLSVKASYLAEVLGYDVHILSLNQGNESPFYVFSTKIKFHNIEVVGNVARYIQSYVNGIKQTIKQVQPDVISVCDDGLKGFFVPLILSKKQPIIYERHASISHNTSVGIKGKIVKKTMLFLATKFSKFIVLTNSNQKEWNTSNCQVIPNPLSFYSDDSSSHRNSRIIVVGTHSFNKGYDLLLNVWKIVSKKHPHWTLEIYGKVDKNKTFVKLANQLNLNASIKFSPPIINIEVAYLNASILLLASRTEGFGMVLIEAMACGVPCIAFDCPSGPADIITNNIDGILIDNGDIIKMADNIIKLIENNKLRIQMGKYAKLNVKRYLPENIIPLWDDLFISLTS